MIFAHLCGIMSGSRGVDGSTWFDLYRGTHRSIFTALSSALKSPVEGGRFATALSALLSANYCCRDYGTLPHLMVTMHHRIQENPAYLRLVQLTMQHHVRGLLRVAPSTGGGAAVDFFPRAIHVIGPGLSHTYFLSLKIATHGLFCPRDAELSVLSCFLLRTNPTRPTQEPQETIAHILNLSRWEQGPRRTKK